MRINALIGFARKAGKITLGRRSTVKALERGKISLVILASDAGSSLKREIMKLASKAGVDVAFDGSKREIGKIVGREACSVLGFIDRRMAEGVMKLEQDKGLRVGKNNGIFKQGANGQNERFRYRGKDSHEYDR
ncbi:MAG: ribosomal L7Ae/L30e/S12e/Gadd45 family protein [Synergistetes bacterium]|nr:ribosomal L7Ae/L30e/S12e/Gadd45 family protein [Synergistota bacterium]